MKPCPFCGSQNIWESPGRKGTTKGNPFLYCKDCGAEGPYDRDEWNTRANKGGHQCVQTLFYGRSVLPADAHQALDALNEHWQEEIDKERVLTDNAWKYQAKREKELSDALADQRRRMGTEYDDLLTNLKQVQGAAAAELEAKQTVIEMQGADLAEMEGELEKAKDIYRTDRLHAMDGDKGRQWEKCECPSCFLHICYQSEITELKGEIEKKTTENEHLTKKIADKTALMWAERDRVIGVIREVEKGL